VALSTDKRDLLLDPITNDLVIGTDLAWSTGLVAVAQSCRIALQMFAGEWFLDLDAGIPYFQEILGARAGLAIRAAQLEFGSALRAVDGVVEILQLDISFDGPSRTLTIVWAVRCAFGDTTPDTILLPLPTSGGS
jgi:hypothetical protein